MLIYTGNLTTAAMSVIAAFLALGLVGKFHKCDCQNTSDTSSSVEPEPEKKEFEYTRDDYSGDETLPLIGDDEISRRQHYSNKQAHDSMIYRNRSQRDAVADFMEDELSQENHKQWWGEDDWLDEMM